MKKKLKNLMSVVIAIFLLSACGQVEAVSTPVPVEPSAISAVGLAPEKYSKYVGMNYPPLPEDLSDSFSMIIQDSDEYGLWLILDGADKMLWLSKLTHRDASGNAYWEVQDILELSNLEAGLTLIPDGCFLNGQPDNEIIVVSKDGTTRLAWRANTMLNIFEAIPTTGIECHSDKGMSLE